MCLHACPANPGLPHQRARFAAARLVRKTLLTGTALSSLLVAIPVTALVIDAAQPVFAAGGLGAGGAAGGTDDPTATGGAGSPDSAGGGGGGAGATGGKGGEGIPSGAGGFGGLAPGNAGNRNGTNGGDVGIGGGGGGGGGAHGFVDTVLPTADSSGGHGGKGGSSLGPDGNKGGGGGAGGYGAVVIGTGLSGTIGVNLTGGNGGAGGLSADGGGGGGGSGGIGLVFTNTGNAAVISGLVSGGAGGAGAGAGGASGNGGNGGAGIAGSGLTLTIHGSVTGGAGGVAGFGSGTAGAGGTGIIGQDLNVIVSGAVAGGVSGIGVQADAITFTGGINTLELWQGYSLTGNVAASGTSTLRFGGDTNAAFDLGGLGSSFLGFTTLEKNGASTWTLTGTSTFAGPTSVNAGTLLVNGSLENSAFTVNANGILGGTGNVGSVTVNGGVFAPGNGSPGSQMSLYGNLVLDAASTYRVFVNSSSVSSALVNGSATLGDATVNARFVTGAYVTHQYVILRATGLNGSFSTVTTTNLPTGFAASVFNQGNDVILQLTAQFGAIGVGGLPARSVAHALNDFFNNGGALPPEFVRLFGLTGDALRNGLGQASGESGASVSSSTFAAWSQFFNLVFDPFADNRGGFGGASAFASTSQVQSDAVRMAYAAVTPKGMVTKAAPAAPYVPRWSVWGGGYGGSTTTEGNAATGSHDTTSRAYGFAAGADYRLRSDTLLGFALAGGGTSFGVAQGMGGGTSDMFQASVYARQTWGTAYLMGAFGYGFQDFTLKRTVTIAGSDALQADFKAHTLAGRAEAGYRFGSLFAGATPYGAVQVASLDLPAYAERATSGSDVFALAYQGQTVTQTRSELGARFDYAMPLHDALLTLRGRTAWAHDYDSDRAANAGFLALPGTAFTMSGAIPDADSLLVSAGAELSLRNGFSLAGSFEGEFSGNTESYAGKGAVRYRW